MKIIRKTKCALCSLGYAAYHILYSWWDFLCPCVLKWFILYANRTHRNICIRFWISGRYLFRKMVLSYHSNIITYQMYSKCKLWDLDFLPCKVECVFEMVIVSILPYAKFGPNDHRKDTPRFIDWPQGIYIEPRPYRSLNCCHTFFILFPYFFNFGHFSWS